jgi:hypothetical protein
MLGGFSMELVEDEEEDEDDYQERCALAWYTGKGKATAWNQAVSEHSKEFKKGTSKGHEKTMKVKKTIHVDPRHPWSSGWHGWGSGGDDHGGSGGSKGYGGGSGSTSGHGGGGGITG